MKVILLIVLLFQLFCGTVRAQQVSPDTPVGRYDSLQVLSSEKVHLHLDKPYYAAGQTIWFKAYVVDVANQPSMLSKILYVDLVDDQRRIKRSLKLPLAAGLASGDIALPDTLSAGRYRIRAYTQWMRNYGEDSFYDHSFILVNSWKNQDEKKTVSPVLNKIALQFFPEGGNLVEGLRSRVAFKAIGTDGLGVDVTGAVIDDTGSEVAVFKTEHAGMGSFMFTPFAGHTYKVVLNSKAGPGQFTLPQAVEGGYVMNVSSNEPDHLMARITGSRAGTERNKEYKMIVTAFDGSTFQTTFKMNRQFADLRLPLTAVPAGVARLTLFDKEALPLAERLVFIRPDDHLQLELTTEKQVYKPRERVKMTLQASNGNDTALTGSFSVSVTDMNRITVDEVKESTIFSELLLKSELKGFVENPNYYFTDTIRKTVRQRHLDNLMLTQGWRRLSWQQNGQVRYPPEDGISISGTLLRGGKVVSGGRVTLFTPDAGLFMDTLTNEEGRFNFDKLVFPDSSTFVVQGRNERSKSNVKIRLDQIARQSVTIHNFQDYSYERENEIATARIKELKEELLELLDQGLIKRTNLLEEVVVKAVRDPKKLENSSKMGSIPADYVFRADDLSGINLAFALKGKVLGLDYYVDPRSGAVTAKLPRNNLMSGARNMEIFLDGMPIGDDFTILSMADIAYVEVIKGLGANSAIYGNRAFGGLVVVTTKGYAGMPFIVQEEPEGIIKYVPQGYTLSREFYSPDYSVADTAQAKADFRSTIFWQPDVFIDQGRSPEIEFFTADTPGTYRAVVEGLDYKGRLGRKWVVFEVK